MTLEFTKGARFDGNAILQQIQDHFTHGVDLIGIGMHQHLLTVVPVGLFENTLQEQTLSS